MIKTKRTFLKKHFQSLVANIMKYPMHSIVSKDSIHNMHIPIRMTHHFIAENEYGSDMSRLGLLQWENVMNIALISSLIFS